MNKHLLKIIFLFLILSFGTGLQAKIANEELTILNSNPAYKRPCVVTDGKADGQNSFSNVVKRLHNRLDNREPHCKINNSPNAHLILFAPQGLNDESPTTTSESIHAKVSEEVVLRISNNKHVIMAGYKTYYKRKCLGKDCNGWGGCIERRFDDDLNRTEHYDEADTHINRCDFGDHDSNQVSSINSGYQGSEDRIYDYHGLYYNDASGAWYTYPWAKYVIRDDLDSGKIPIFNWQNWENKKKPVIFKQDDESASYRAVIKLENDAANLEFYVAQGAKLSLRFLDIHSKARLQFCGPGTVEFTGVTIYGEGDAETMIEICNDPNAQPKFVYKKNQDNLSKSYGLRLVSKNAGLQSYFKMSGERSAEYFLDAMQFGGAKPTLQLMTDNLSSFPKPFLETRENISSISCRPIDDDELCQLQNRPQYSHSIFNQNIQAFVPADFDVNHPNLKIMNYDQPHVENEQVSIAERAFYYDAKGIPIVKETDFNPVLIRAAAEIMNNRMQPFHNNTIIFTAILPPAPNPDCDEGFYWEPAISQCMANEPDPTPPPAPDCGEATWDAATEDCECEEGKIYNSTTKRCEAEEICTVDCDAELPEGDEGAETAEEDEDEGTSQKAGGCSLVQRGQRGQVLTFHFLLGFLVFVLFVLRHRARGIL